MACLLRADARNRVADRVPMARETVYGAWRAGSRRRVGSRLPTPLPHRILSAILIVGLAKAGRVAPATVDDWVEAARGRRPVLDPDVMSQTFLRYKGAEAGRWTGARPRRFPRTSTRCNVGRSLRQRRGARSESPPWPRPQELAHAEEAHPAAATGRAAAVEGAGQDVHVRPPAAVQPRRDVPRAD